MKLETVLKTVIKLAAVMLTSPATWAVAGGLYTDPVQRLIVQIAALVLVEGALLLGWHLLDTNRQAETAQRWLYACMAMVAYAGLWWLAVAHGEGLSGIVFRGTLGVLLVYSIADAGLLATIKQDRAADGDISRHGAVKKYRRDAAIKHARLTTDAEYEVSRARLEADKLVSLQQLASVKDQQLAGVKVAHRSEMAKLSQSVGFPYPVEKARDASTKKRRADQRIALDRTLSLIRVNPHASFREIGDMANVSHETARRLIDRLKVDGVINGDSEGGYYLAAPVVEASQAGNGNGHHG